MKRLISSILALSLAAAALLAARAGTGRPSEAPRATRVEALAAAGPSAHLLGTSAAADDLGVSQSTLRRWLKEGRIQGRKVGKRWRFQLSDLASMVNLPAEEPAAAIAPPERGVLEQCDRLLDGLLADRGIGKGRIATLAREIAAQTHQTRGSDPASAGLVARLLLVAVRSAASDLHTSDALAAPRRLIDLGIKPFLVSSSFQCVVAQRLVRLICPDCKVAHAPGPEELDALGLTGEDRRRTFHRGRGCPKCSRLGYRGRVAVFELLEFPGAVRDALLEGTPGQLEEAARSAGWRPMREVALGRLFRGETTVEEVLRETVLADRARMA